MTNPVDCVTLGHSRRTQRAVLAWAVLSGICLVDHVVAAPPDVKPTRTSPRIVNIINFIRGVEPRAPIDLVEPVREQLRLAQQYQLPSTYLIQYDALIKPEFTDLLKAEMKPEDEIGAWLEVVQPQVEAAGLKWRGRYPWDWHTDVGFTIGYTPDARRKLIDVYMAKFKQVFGKLPRSVGCWVLDAPTLNYLYDKYGIVAACICKDQIGTDGYNLWGGYWNQAYYPSRLNAYMPAQTKQQQLPVPVFRMLGSDPIYQYDTGLGGAVQGVITLEPVYPDYGGNPKWVQWFFNTYFNTVCLAFSYVQVGQENSFGWPAMSKGLEDQYALLAEYTKQKNVYIETLESSGRWFRKTFDFTPATSVVAFLDYRHEDRQSVWYESRFYRINLLWDGVSFRVRDLHLFDENYAERYLTEPVTTNHCTYDALPVVDGFHWSAVDGTLAGLRVVQVVDGTPRELEHGTASVSVLRENELVVSTPVQADGFVMLHLKPESIEIKVMGDLKSQAWAVELSWDADKATAIVGIDEHAIGFNHNGFEYRVTCADATLTRSPAGRGLLMTPTGKKLVLSFSTGEKK